MLMVSVPDRMPMIVTGNNVEMTPALKDYAMQKVDKVVSKHKEYVIKADIHLTVNRNPSVKLHHVAEVTAAVKGHTIRSSYRSDNMYAAIDLMSDGLARKLRKYKERRRNKMHRSHGHSALREPLIAEDDGAEIEAEEFEAEAEAYGSGFNLDIMKRKAFKMDPITPEEAAFCLDYIDHPFYVFRNADTDDINVVYKRNHGGVGLIEPEK